MVFNSLYGWPPHRKIARLEQLVSEIRAGFSSSVLASTHKEGRKEGRFGGKERKIGGGRREGRTVVYRAFVI